MNVDPEFLVEHPFPYPSDNKVIFEKWLMLNPISEIESREYLPIQWTGYYVKHNFGKDIKAIQRLQDFLNKIPRDKKYYTVVQYDDGILNDISHLDIKVFGMSHSPTVDIPLVCLPHGKVEIPKKIYTASFVGRSTHSCREELHKVLNSDPNFIVQLVTKNYSLTDYLRIMKASVFTLCPRGYGNTSFRLCEALEQGSIPVYISDDFMKPFLDFMDISKYSVLVDILDIKYIKDILLSLNQETIENLQYNGGIVYNNMYTYSGLRELILNNLQLEKNIKTCIV